MTLHERIIKKLKLYGETIFVKYDETSSIYIYKNLKIEVIGDKELKFNSIYDFPETLLYKVEKELDEFIYAFSDPEDKPMTLKEFTDYLNNKYPQDYLVCVYDGDWPIPVTLDYLKNDVSLKETPGHIHITYFNLYPELRNKKIINL